MDRLGKKGEPFLFIIDFEAVNPMLYALKDLPSTIRYSTPGHPEIRDSSAVQGPVTFERSPMSYPEYLQAFRIVHHHLHQGNSYLVNLTFPTPVHTSLSLQEIFSRSLAPYRLLVEDQFVVFSPEPFVTICDGMIRSFPMKGTIDASEPDAREKVLSDPKESAEHNTIVDLIRNDLSRVASSVTVKRFRYIDRIRTLDREILQVSSEIEGKLEPDYNSRLGRIFKELLPAGSVSGAPKKRTLEIIRDAEGSPRGYYTGVFGIFDGNSLESAVMIRFIERSAGGFQFRSGGGITHLSDPEKEYEEMVTKAYLDGRRTTDDR
ncbi:MAG: aminodeoxychorismate synthase component I [Bacteroidetes bacterium GWF2_49_14]|nr:MAG: aminodeoxychorismate synthase component I [Bacteroidetes bacterium GWF2_49_14]